MEVLLAGDRGRSSSAHATGNGGHVTKLAKVLLKAESKAGPQPYEFLSSVFRDAGSPGLPAAEACNASRT
jgi:hypothetical protein